jgi:hypothetical protein
VKDYWDVKTESGKENRDVITICWPAAEALAKSVSSANGNGGHSFTCSGKEIWHNKEGDLKHCHPGIFNAKKQEVVQAENAITKYCPHILFAVSWN